MSGLCLKGHSKKSIQDRCSSQWSSVSRVREEYVSKDNWSCFTYFHSLHFKKLFDVFEKKTVKSHAKVKNAKVKVKKFGLVIKL